MHFEIPIVPWRPQLHAGRAGVTLRLCRWPNLVFRAHFGSLSILSGLLSHARRILPTRTITGNDLRCLLHSPPGIRA